MLISKSQFFIVLCEGVSEYAYIQELNRFFREKEIAVVLHPHVVGTGFYSDVVRKYKELRRENQRSEIRIWVDWDLYARNDRGCLNAYQSKPAGVPDFLFSRQNFEDFLVTHLSQERLMEWARICNEERHLQTPLHSDEYLALFCGHLFPVYSKGELPFELNDITISRMLANQQLPDDMPFKCDIADFIRNILQDRDLNP